MKTSVLGVKGVVFAVFIGWIRAVRRRRAQDSEHVPSELADPQRWPKCARWDGGEQACVCWFGERQRAWVEDEGREWPGGDVGMFRDWLEAVREYPCQAPFDWSLI